jgi:broad specificity phosphatase PhoE
MSTLYLVRHGQASFGAADYDQLSELGARQCRRLGEYFAERGIRFDAVLMGSLRRHAQSHAALAEGLGKGLGNMPAPRVWPGLNEYDSEALIRAVLTPEEFDRMAADRSPEGYRAHFRVLRTALNRWAEGEIEPRGMPSWRDFVGGIVGALDLVRERHHGGQVLIVSSGGPIATAVAQVLGAPHQTAIELNLRIRNSAVTEFSFTPKRHMLQSFNGIPHLDAPAYDGWVSYS